MLIEFMRRGFGVKDLDHFVRMRYAYGKDSTENFARYHYLMENSKKRVERISSTLTNNLRAAYSSYPNSMHEYEVRRDYQNAAIINCEQLLKELQKIVEIFEVDMNLYSLYVETNSLIK